MSVEFFPHPPIGYNEVGIFLTVARASEKQLQVLHSIEHG